MVETPSILITDDDTSFRETLCAALEPRGYQMLTASDGAEALEIFRSRVVHLVLLDMHMPRYTGLQTVRLFHEVNSGLPCILMSAKLDDEIRREAAAADVFSVMPKPIELTELNANVTQALHATYGW